MASKYFAQDSHNFVYVHGNGIVWDFHQGNIHFVVCIFENKSWKHAYLSIFISFAAFTLFRNNRAECLFVPGFFFPCLEAKSRLIILTLASLVIYFQLKTRLKLHSWDGSPCKLVHNAWQLSIQIAELDFSHISGLISRYKVHSEQMYFKCI